MCEQWFLNSAATQIQPFISFKIF